VNLEFYVKLNLVLLLNRGAACSLERVFVPLLPNRPNDAHEE